MLTVSFIRHGESEDNLPPKSIWAGWRDAPLSALGRKQAYALGQRLNTVNLDAIYSSDLKRARSTALALNDARPAEQQIPLTVNPKLREQHFGIAEGKKWVPHAPPGISLEELFEQGIYPVLSGRDAKFPGGESLDDLARRCEEALKECVLPHLQTRTSDSDSTAKNSHIAITSHRACIGELVAALLRLDPESRRDISYSRVLNAAWVRAVITVRDGYDGEIDAHNPPHLEVRIVEVNNKNHLDNLEEVAGPIEEGKDESAAELKAFFGGASL